MAGKSLDEADLPVREVDEAKEFGLSPRQWITLRKRFHGEQTQQRLRDLETTWKAECTQGLKSALRAEMLPELRVQAEKELGQRIREETQAKMSEEERARTATPAQRELAKEFFRDVEVDCRAQAEAASRMVDVCTNRYTWLNTIRNIAFWPLAIALFPYAWWVYSHSKGVSDLSLYAYVLPWLIAMYLTGSEDNIEARKKQIAEYQRVSSAYIIAADIARQARAVDVDLAVTRGDLQSRISSIGLRKTELDQQFHVDTRLLQAARVTVLDDMSRTIDPEKIINEDRKRIAAQFDALVPEEGAGASMRNAG